MKCLCPKKPPLKTPLEGSISVAASLSEEGRRRSSVVLYICCGERKEEHNSSQNLFKETQRIELKVSSAEVTLVQTLTETFS